MPTYNYNCQHCANSFTAMKKVDERGTAECPKCKNIAPKTDKLEASGLSFKGKWFKNTGGY